jgi:mannitol 2-dehydrogenase
MACPRHPCHRIGPRAAFRGANRINARRVPPQAETGWPEMTAEIALPRYDRSKLKPGIVHIGLGNFHRAHMAVYLDDLFNLGESHDWAIIGAGVRAPDSRMRDALKGQDCLSTIIELDPAGKTCRRVGAMIDFLPVEADNA